MDKKTLGAWVIHHAQKLQGVTAASGDYEQIDLAGKCGILLSALSANSQHVLTTPQLLALARAAGISRLELPAITAELERQKLIESSNAGIDILGLTSNQTLEHTATVFSEADPRPCELAVTALAEDTSETPLGHAKAKEMISDVYHVPSAESDDILRQAEQIGFVDAEKLDDANKIYFNGSIFRRDDVARVNRVLESLSTSERQSVLELSEMLTQHGCISIRQAMSVVTEDLFKKLNAIGFFDVNTVANDLGHFSFVTKPAAFSKFTNTIADDALDLAKALVTSLTYGMTQSRSGRGRIRMIEALMSRLIAGGSVGPATAIGQDYKVLEMRGVVQVSDAGGGMYRMRLLKKEVGRLALAVITEGEAATQAVTTLPSASATDFYGPETNRVYNRRKQTAPLKKSVATLLQNLRTGGM